MDIKDAVKLSLEYWGCGDECACLNMRIRAYYKLPLPFIPQPYQLTDDDLYSEVVWESSWFNHPMEEEEIEELREQTSEACERYGIKAVLAGYPSDWETDVHILRKASVPKRVES